MKNGTVIINTARGDLVDGPALVRALVSGKVAAAGLDVLPQEQVIREAAGRQDLYFAGSADCPTMLANYVLFGLPNVLITPHRGFFSSEASQRLLETTIANIEAFINGKPQHVVF